MDMPLKHNRSKNGLLPGAYLGEPLRLGPRFGSETKLYQY